MIESVIILLVGLIVLAKSSDFVVEKSMYLSHLTHVSEIIMGFVFLSFATSLPELVVTLMSGLQGFGTLGLGTFIGSSIGDMLLVFGIISLIGFFQIFRKNYNKVLNIALLTSGIAMFFIVLGRIDFMFGIFCIVLFYFAAKSIIRDSVYVPKKKVNKKKLSVIRRELIKEALLVFAGIVLLIVSAKLITDSSIAVSEFFGIYESVLGATIIALGSLLPELSISISAIRKTDVDLAVGNLVGSLLVNMTFILGIAAIISPVVLDPVLTFALGYMIVANVAFVLIAHRSRFGRNEGLLLVSLYAIYLLIITGGMLA